MLVLTRKLDEKIVIPEFGITITLVAAQSGKARIGIEAPNAVKIMRQELLEKQEPPAPAPGPESAACP